MTQEAAIEYALSEKEPASSPESEATSSGVREDVLSRREQEVAVLLSRGLTNRRIAKELLISERTVDPHEFEHITSARLLIAQGDYDEALGLLDRLLEGAEAGGRGGNVIEILVLKALALKAQNDMPNALATLHQALTLAEPEGYVRTFIDEGTPIATLLKQLLEAHKTQHPSAAEPTVSLEYVEKLLEALEEDGRISTKGRAQSPSSAATIEGEVMGDTAEAILMKYKEEVAKEEYSKASSKPEERSPEPVKLFCSYSHRDERYLTKLKTSLAGLRREGLIEEWHDRKIRPGQEWEEAIDENLETSEIILLLITPDFMSSDYSFEKEMSQALERHDRGEARVIPIIVRPTDWEGAPFGKLQALPKNAKPITEWSNRDRAWLDVVRGIREAVKELTNKTDYDQEAPLSKHQEHQSQLDELYAQARQFYHAQNWQEVDEIFSQIHEIEPHYPDPEGLLQR
jgi:tetratricopeptide (TPR) repeat protein